MSKRDIDLQRVPKALNAGARVAINRGLPVGNQTLSEIQARELGLAAELRKGTARVRVFRNTSLT